MSEFTSDSDFSEFVRIVKSGEQGIGAAGAQRFLDAVLDGARSRELVVPKGFTFWRAALGSDMREVEQSGGKFEQDAPHPPKRMIPSPEFARDGRANAEGVPCFYAATDKKTAMAEVRPWLNGLVSVACFQLLKDIKIVDCSKFHAEHAFCKLLDRRIDDMESPLTSDEINKAVWTDIDQSFSKPVARADDKSEYITTQKIAELFSRNGYEGIAYKSMLTTDGFNIAIFDPSVVEQAMAQLFCLEVLEHKFSEFPIDEYYCKR